MPQPSPARLSKREREIMDILYRLGEAGAHEVVARMAEDLSYDTVRVTLSILEKKGYLVHHQEGRRYIFKPVMNREKASRQAVNNLVQTFFEGSLRNAVGAHLADPASEVSAEELEWLSEMIRKARKKGE